MSQYTHSQLVKIAEKWLINSKKCGFALAELSTQAGEIPDAIGFKSLTTILIECKTSLSDFHQDKKKHFRRNSYLGLGSFRYFLCEKDLIKPEQLPDKWGLLYVNDKGKVRQKIGPKGNLWERSFIKNNKVYKNPFYFEERNETGERYLMYSALRRLHLQGAIPKIYNTPWKKS